MIVCYLMSDDIGVHVESYDLMNYEKTNKRRDTSKFS